MKKISLVIFGLVMALGTLKAQSNQSWQPLAFISGTGSFNGVDGYCMLTTCNGTPTVLVKLVNNNSYSIKAGWKDMIITKDEQHLSGNFVQDSVTIGHNSEVVGDCNTVQLAYKLSAFGADASSFNYLTPIDFGFKISH